MNSRAMAGNSKADLQPNKNYWIITLFIVGLCIPIQLSIGPVRLSAYRIVLLIALVPAILAWFSMKQSKTNATDIFMVMFALWGALSLLVMDGVALSVESSVIFIVETWGSYIIARSFVRTPEDFAAIAKILFYCILFFLPFAVIEALTDRTLLLDVLGKVFPVWRNIWDFKRLGLERAQVVFEHPILFGVFCASGFALSIYVVNFGRTITRTLGSAFLIFCATFLSLSSGALTMLASLLSLTIWDRMLVRIPRRWLILFLLIVLAYVVVDIISNRTPIHVFVSYLTFSSHNSYTRILIFESSSEAIFKSPWFGYGLTNEWELKWEWLTRSVDNFFLLIALRHGFPALIFFSIAILYVFINLAKLKIVDSRLVAYRAGLLITLGGLIIAGTTVHYWNAIYALFMFLLGSGAWLADYSPKTETKTEEVPVRRGLRSGILDPGYARSDSSKN